jgi:Xaa-Pro aminopeptidase
MLNNRASILRALLVEQRLDALLVTRPANLRYFSGFTGTDGALIVTAQETIFLTDSRYTTQATQEVTADQRREYAVQAEGIIAALDDCCAGRIGYEAEDLTCAALERLRACSGQRMEWLGLDRPLLALRGIKDNAEIEALERAAHLAATAFEEIVPLLRPGLAEREIAIALEFAMRRLGGDEKSFDLIVASGERGALPHGAASDRLLRAGEFVTIDFGLRLHGYCSDETVTLALGEIDAELERVYATVYQAQQQALASIRPGVPLKEIDAVARNSITEAGYGPFFGHGLGHGVGLEVHEYPTLSPRSVDTAQVGMVFTVEPGIYLPGKGGVRLEDMVVVTPDGCRKLTRIPKELRRLC